MFLKQRGEYRGFPDWRALVFVHVEVQIFVHTHRQPFTEKDPYHRAGAEGTVDHTASRCSQIALLRSRQRIEPTRDRQTGQVSGDIHD